MVRGSGFYVLYRLHLMAFAFALQSSAYGNGWGRFSKRDRKKERDWIVVGIDCIFLHDLHR